MTSKEALASAKHLFSASATVEIDLPHFYPRKRYIHPTGSFSVFSTGEGRNWDEALNQAHYKEMKKLGVWS